MRYAALFLVLALPAVGQAQTDGFSMAPTLDCIEAARRSDQRALCVGEAARACIQRKRPASKLDVTLCLGEETAYWTERMNDALAAMEQRARADDAAFAETALAEKVPFKLVEDLAAMQADWLQWRETRCAFEAMLRRGTPNAGTAAASCMMTQTGAQALFLERSAAYEK